jgi:hypothetical protein
MVGHVTEEGIAMAFLIRKQPKEVKWYRKPSLWFGLLNLFIAGAALYFAYRADSRAAKEAEADIRLEAKIDPSTVFFGQSSLYWSGHGSDHLSGFSGLQIFIEARLYNNGLLPISVDEVRAITIIGNTITTGPIPAICYDSDHSSALSYPIDIPSHAQKRVFLRVSLPTDSTQQAYLLRFANSGLTSLRSVAEEFHIVSHMYWMLDEDMKDIWITAFDDILIARNTQLCSQAVRTNVVVVLASGETTFRQVTISRGKCGGIGDSESPGN